MKTMNQPLAVLFVFIVVCLFIHSPLGAQNRQLVWSDEFNGTSVDPSLWTFETGATFETLQFFTDRPENAKIVDGALHIIAREESYQGFDYTAALLKTQGLFYWQYGRIEARIKLPQGTGFVPAFWMLPEDDLYGFWPWSGEIDIMEHPTNQDRIYGTCHTWEYSYFTGSGQPAGGSIQVSDSETAFHIYAIEWTPNKIDFFVDDQKYYTFSSDQSGFRTWPFDQPFFIIVSMAVGGGWVGPPDASTVFPAAMQVDYVRVYQDVEDIVIGGPDYVLPSSTSLTYFAPNIDGASYLWSVPNTAHITSGQGTSRIMVDWGSFSGNVELLLTTADGFRVIQYPVVMANNLLKNASFETGVKYWRSAGSFPAKADFILSTQDKHSGLQSLFVDVQTPGVNPWDAQLSQTNIALKAGQTYYATCWAKSETNSQITIAVIDASTFELYGSTTVQLTDMWKQYEFNFNAPSDAIASFNIDLGGHTGTYYFDDVGVAVPMQEKENQLTNADFAASTAGWVFNAFAPAEAGTSIVDGEIVISITNAGVNPWDIHLGQTGVTVEQGKKYTVSFDAHASAPRSISPLVGKNSDPWTVFSGNQTVELSTRRQTYEFTFIMNEPTDTNARFGIDLGASSGDVILDNVFLSQGTWPATVSHEKQQTPRSFKVYQNTPNPFNPETTIRYELLEPTIVTLDVFDVNGKLVETLVHAFQSAGMHSVTWDGKAYASGIYLCKITADNNSQVQRMALIK